MKFNILKMSYGSLKLSIIFNFLSFYCHSYHIWSCFLCFISGDNLSSKAYKNCCSSYSGSQQVSLLIEIFNHKNSFITLLIILIVKKMYDFFFFPRAVGCMITSLAFPLLPYLLMLIFFSIWISVALYPLYYFVGF